MFFPRPDQKQEIILKKNLIVMINNNYNTNGKIFMQRSQFNGTYNLFSDDNNIHLILDTSIIFPSDFAVPNTYFINNIKINFKNISEQVETFREFRNEELHGNDRLESFIDEVISGIIDCANLVDIAIKKEKNDQVSI